MYINIFDSNGVTSPIFPGEPTKYIHYEYVFNQMVFDGITIFTDNYIFNTIVDQVNCKTKIAWIYEPRAIDGSSYNIYKIEDKFDFIFTFDQELLNRSDKYKFVPTGSCWIPKDSRIIGEKTKIVSSIMSAKQTTDGHRLRHTAYNQFKNKVDFYGGYCRPVSTKDIALSDYMFSLCIENSSVDNYFTEKLIDCFATGTIPIYYGCKNIDKYFDTDGMFIFNNLSELEDIINNLTPDMYFSKLNSVKKNFETSKQYYVMEDWVYENILSKI